jgi:cytochrome P450
MTTDKNLIDTNLLAPEWVANPYPLFHTLQSIDPVHWSERHRSWLLTRYADVWAAFKDPNLSADRISPFFTRRANDPELDDLDPMFKILSNWMVFKDPPDHTRLRRLAYRSFTPRVIEALRPRIHVIVEQLLSALEEQQRIDLVHAFAYPLPAIVIAEMLGVPTEDRDTFKQWSDDIMLLLFGAQGESQRHQRAQQSLLALADYFDALIEKYRQKPANNLISAFLHTHSGNEHPPTKENLTNDELISTCVLLLFGGHETTTNLISNGLLALLKHPEQRHLLQSDSSLMPGAVEEFLRYDGPSKISVRWAKHDVEIGGEKINSEQRVFLIQAAANRDPNRFPDPDKLNIQRKDNQHLGFGYGIHYCLGAPLARLETQIAIEALLRHFPNMQLHEETIEWHATILSRGLKTLQIDKGEHRAE